MKKTEYPNFHLVAEELPEEAGELEDISENDLIEASEDAVPIANETYAVQKHLIDLFGTLSRRRQGQLLGYLDALYSEELYEGQIG